MNTPQKQLTGLLSLAALIAVPGGVHAQSFTDPNFANSVVSSSGLGSNSLYNDPNATLGRPATQIYGGYDTPRGEYHVSMAYAPYYTDQKGGSDVITSLGSSGTVTVKFDAPIVHSAQHWYGDDFILFGNTFFPGSGSVTPTTDMSKLHINGRGAIYQNGAPQVSVSSDDVTWYSLSPGSPYYPTNPYHWAGVSAQNPSGWDDGSLNDFTKPVNPDLLQPSDTHLSVAAFAGQSVAFAANTLYDGSAGGAAFSLTGLVDKNGNPITSISYIRFSGDPKGGTSNVDAVSRVGFDPPAAPEPAPLLIFVVGAAGLFTLRRRTSRA